MDVFAAQPGKRIKIYENPSRKGILGGRETGGEGGGGGCGCGGGGGGGGGGVVSCVWGWGVRGHYCSDFEKQLSTGTARSPDNFF